MQDREIVSHDTFEQNPATGVVTMRMHGEPDLITPAVFIGAIVERMKYSAVMTFVALWMFVVYFPLAHMVWGRTGLMEGLTNTAARKPWLSAASARG